MANAHDVLSAGNPFCWSDIHNKERSKKDADSYRKF